MNKRSHVLGSVLFLAVAGGYSCSPSAAPISDAGPEPKPPPPLSRQELQQPNACASCHEDHFREWSGSMHAYASEDPVFVAMNRRGQRETGGALGNFCVQCHAPLAVREGATVDGLNLDQLPSSMKGVNCYFCHSVDAVEGSHNNPLRLSTDGLMRGGIADPLLVGTHGSAYSALHARDKAVSAALCGTCHDVTNAVGVPIERTYKEWQDSVFSTSKGATCNQCHMGESLEPKPAAKVDGANPRKLHAHDSPGVDVALTPFPQTAEQRRGVQELLNTSVQSAVCVAQAGDQFSLRVILDNVGGGHKFPSGAAHDRRVWVEVVAYDGDRVLYESGTRYGDGKLGPEEDPDLWALRDCLYDKDGNYTSMFWKAASHESNLLPAQATFDPKDPRYYQTHFLRSFPLQGGLRGKPSKVTLRVRMRPLGADVVDELIASGDLDPIYRDKIPTFDLGTEPITVWTPDMATGTYYEDRLPVSCASASNMNVQAQKTPFEPAPRCRR